MDKVISKLLLVALVNPDEVAVIAPLPLAPVTVKSANVPTPATADLVKLDAEFNVPQVAPAALAIVIDAVDAVFNEPSPHNT